MSDHKRVLVLGANGFIGSHLVDSLAGKNFEVVAFDRFSSPARFNDNANVSQVRGDLFELSDISKALEGADYVVHAFSATTPYSADLDPFIDIEKNLLHSAKIFELCAKHQVKKIVYISSGGTIYGASAENGKSAKETDVAEPISPYGISKLAAERYLKYFEVKYGIKHVSYRLTNPYGPRQVTKHNQGVIPKFIENISQGKTITLYGDGSSSRDYIYIGNAVQLISDTFEHAKQDIYNLGSGQQTSLSSLIAVLEELLHSKAMVETLPEPPTFVHTTQLDLSRFTSEFNLRADVDLKDGLARTIEQLSKA